MKRSFPISEDLNEHHKSKGKCINNIKQKYEHENMNILVSLVEGDNYQCRFPLFNTANGNNHLVDLAMEIQMVNKKLQTIYLITLKLINYILNIHHS